MKKAVASWVLAAVLLSSCSLLQRNTDEFEDEAAPPFDPSESAQSLETEGAAPSASLDSEVSRLNTRISALETKLDVLSASMERSQALSSQPVIEARSEPEPNMAAPVADSASEEPTVELSSAPARPVTALPVGVKSASGSSAGSEKEFQSAMELFQGGKNLEAASRFALFAKKYPRHLLASHALYWAGESSARAQQWSLAMENWEELEKNYPRSAYLPEALAGLAKAYENQGNTAKAKTYRDTLAKAFPKSPVVISRQASFGSERSAATRSHSPAPDEVSEENIPSYDETEEEGHE